MSMTPHDPIPAMKPPPAPTPAPKLTDDELEQRRRQGWNPADAVEHQSRQLQKLLDGQGTLKDSVDRLARPHWVLWATLVATAIAAIAGVILLFR
jgi:hypothetical protein